MITVEITKNKDIPEDELKLVKDLVTLIVGYVYKEEVTI